MPRLFDPNIFDEEIFDTLFWQFVQGIIKLRFASKERVLDFAKKES